MGRVDSKRIVEGVKSWSVWPAAYKVVDGRNSILALHTLKYSEASRLIVVEERCRFVGDTTYRC